MTLVKAFIRQRRLTYIFISFVFGALIAPALVTISSWLGGFLLFKLLLKISNLSLQGAKLAAITVESALTKLTLHVLDHVFDLSRQRTSISIQNDKVSAKGILLARF